MALSMLYLWTIAKQNKRVPADQSEQRLREVAQPHGSIAWRLGASPNVLSLRHETP